MVATVSSQKAIGYRELTEGCEHTDISGRAAVSSPLETYTPLTFDPFSGDMVCSLTDRCLVKIPPVEKFEKKFGFGLI